MKKNILTFCMLTFCLVLFAKQQPASASNYSGKEDSIACLKHYSIYVLNLKKKMYDYTVESWNYMFTNCPDAGVRIYSDGIKLYEHYYKVAQTPQRKAEVVDTIMMIYDQRIKYYGNHPKYPEGWILGRKALDMVKYRRGNLEDMKEAYGLFKSSFDMMGDRSEDVVLFNLLKTSLSLLAYGDIEGMVFLNDFLSVSVLLEKQIAVSGGDDKLRKEKVRDGCEELLVKSGVGDCGSMIPFLQDQYQVDEENSENVTRVLGLMEKLNCTESDLYYTVVEKNYNLNPSSKSAYQLAKMFVKKEEFEKARDYYKEAIEIAAEASDKSVYYYELAVLTFAQFKDYPMAKDLAQKSISLKGDWGKPYLLIGNIYAAASKNYGKDEFERSTVYWAALDKFLKARGVDSSCVDEANEQISLYSQYIPDKESGFFHGLTEGDSYRLGEWINEVTKVRYR
ncbi:tetratricopeptide repeat protein [Plebeiibacterium marinum]|uniref:Tetratricopeptide repeat protein n=1 Tax=Plebeiibacterium marinum TaxID=2992111 RepID=A0AAE3SLB9_9BACT|nr:tetratricopeptide repeat protein [Plebeiobacterium marinum]MCW3807725.1 tetratricopeptide repeat protein [Plebeiobacterium marinum]